VARKHAEKFADIAAKSVPGIHAMGVAIDGAKLHIEELMFGALNKLAPEITNAVDAWDDIDFVKIGEGFASLVSPIISVANALHTVADVASDALNKLLDVTLGEQIKGVHYTPQEVSAWVKGRNARKDKQNLRDDKANVGALTKIGLGGFGGLGVADPLLAENRRHTTLLEEIARNGRMRGPNTTLHSGNLDAPPV